MKSPSDVKSNQINIGQPSLSSLQQTNVLQIKKKKKKLRTNKITVEMFEQSEIQVS
jgi:hypothetical protein